VAYTPIMRRIQLYIEEEVDDALAVEAARRKTSKAALIRDCIARQLPERRAHKPASDDIVGWIDQELPDAKSIDDVVYGR
jgi:hypothetical protein